VHGLGVLHELGWSQSIQPIWGEPCAIEEGRYSWSNMALPTEKL
jgi:hypothetical protein